MGHERDSRDLLNCYLEGRDPGDDGALLDALTDFLHIENFEEREQERGYLDLEVLRFMRSKR
jgi:hypothetical protein